MSDSTTDSAMAPALWPMTAETIEGVRALVTQLEELDEQTGGWTVKAEVRETGFSLYFKFQKRVDVMGTGMTAVNAFQQSPAKLLSACRRLLAAHDSVAG